MEKKFDEFWNKIGWACMTAVALYASSQLQKLSESVSQLNTNIAVIVTRLQAYESQSLEIKARVSSIESTIYKKK